MEKSSNTSFKIAFEVKPMRIVQDFNQHWLFYPEQVDPDWPDARFEAVTLPHTNRLFSQRFVDNRDYQFVSTYRKRFSVAGPLNGQRLFLDFDGAMLESAVYLNGTLLGIQRGGFTPFSFEITRHVTPGENVLNVYVDATENESIPPYGNLVDFLTFGGLYREVFLRAVDPAHMTNVFVRPTDVLTRPGLECDVQLAEWLPDLSVEGILQDAQARVISRHSQPVSADRITLVFPDFGPVERWSLEDPVLYRLVLILSQHGSPTDREVVRFGFRSAEFSRDGCFLLNGSPLKLVGLNRHQTYPYIGAAAPARLLATKRGSRWPCRTCGR
jgi:beta-galactosidase